MAPGFANCVESRRRDEQRALPVKCKVDLYGRGAHLTLASENNTPGSMSIFAFLVAVTCVCLGFATGGYFARRGAGASKSEPGRPRRSSDGSSPSTLNDHQISEFLARVQNVTRDVDRNVGVHASRVAEISGGLSGAGKQDAAAVLAAVAKLLEANQNLQKDLTVAKEKIQTQRRLLDGYMAEALTDSLTELGNRRRFDQELQRRFAQWARGGDPMCLILADIDRFKLFNDEHGHQVGDFVLQRVASVLTDQVRAMDLVARYGGEEFGIILPGTSLAEACNVAERVRAALEQQTLETGGRSLHVTLSAGVAEVALSDDPQLLINRADAALFAAKQAGRNCSRAHNGKECVVVEKRPLRPLLAENARQRIAPFVDGVFPERDLFCEVECEELTALGFTYLLNERPTYDKVLFDLASRGDQSCATATVLAVRNIGTESMPFFRVSCEFVAPVSKFALVEA
jgi:diguanylate cyclase (GGDEF)-like protein